MIGFIKTNVKENNIKILDDEMVIRYFFNIKTIVHLI